MANDNYKNKRLVSNNDDCTAELIVAGQRVTSLPDASAASQPDAPADSINDDDSVGEADAFADAASDLESIRSDRHSESDKVASLEADLRARDEAHSSLQQRHDALTEEIEDRRTINADHAAALEKAEVELHARKASLQTASEEITGLLTKIAEKDAAMALLENQYAELQRQFEGQRSGIAEKDATLEADTQQSENARRELRSSLEESPPDVPLVDISSSDVREIQAQITRTEDYADTLRRNLADLTASYNEVVVRRDELSQSLEQMTEQNRGLTEELTKANSLITEMSAAIEQQQAEKQAVNDIDDSMSGRLDDKSAPRDTAPEGHIVLAGDDAESISRFMIGNVGNKVLRFQLFKDRVTIGRTRENDIRIKTSYISRQHAVVLTEGDRTRVIDSGSSNGVFVNSRRVKEHVLSNGDIVTVGDAKLRYMERHERRA